jgi:hypothetical protein
MVGRECLQERRESGANGFEPTRQLEHDRPKLVLERLDPFEEAPDALLGILEALHVREIATALAGEHEAFGRRLAPAAEGVDLDQSVEGAVDLDRIEPLGVEAELIAALCHAARVERATPVPIAPA